MLFKTFLSAKLFSGTALPEKYILLGIYYLRFIMQFLFLYALPLIVLEQKPFFAALLDNFKVLWKVLFPTLIVFAAGASLFLPVFYLKVKTTVLMGRFFPEVVIYILSLEIIITFILNCLLTTITTHLFLNERK